ncbi:MAG: hypothetical protein B6243_12280, partial [Anaerolineaceae bacterium 4572_5.2]
MRESSWLYRLAAWGFIMTLVLSNFSPLFTRADAPLPSLDMDGDGISNQMETDGWYNLSGGPYITDPLNIDSDNDGLNDGEEKLYGTIPVNGSSDSAGSESPGIYIPYEAAFETKQYFSPDDEMENDDYGNPIRKYLSVLQGGDDLLMTEAMVVRRGTQFHVGGPSGASLSITGNGLTSLTPAPAPCSSGGSWTVSIPADGTTGTYTATVSLGAWSKSIPVYVIFEFPDNLSDEEIDAYIYDDDPDNKRDEVSVWWRAPEWSYYLIPPYTTTQTQPDCSLYPDQPCSEWQYHQASLYAQAFWTEQFTRKVFVKYAMPAIQGKTSQTAAVYDGAGDGNNIINMADREFRTVYQNTHESWTTAMRKYHPDGNDTDWTMKGGACQDNANIFTTLLRSAGIAAKPFLEDYNKTAGHDEGGQIGTIYEYDHSVLVWYDNLNVWQGARSYGWRDTQDDIYPFANGVKTPRAIHGYGYADDVADLIASSDYRWDFQNLAVDGGGGGMVNWDWDDQIEGIPATEFNNSLNWDIRWKSHRPLKIRRSPYAVILNNESWHDDNWAPGEWRDPPDSEPSGRVATQTYRLDETYNNGNNSIALPDPADPLENWPINPIVKACSPSSAGTADCTAVLDTPGRAAEEEEENISGLSYVGAAAAPAIDAKFNGNFAHKPLDLNGNGKYDALAVSVGIDVSTPGDYRVEGVLVDAQGRQIDRAEWQGSKVPAALQFNIAGTTPPYTLKNLYLYNADGALISSRHRQAYVIDDLGNKLERGVAIGGNATRAITATNFAITSNDTNGNGLIDELAVTVDVSVDPGDAGSYRIEGLLVDQNGKPVDWSVSNLQTLNAGSNTMTLPFDGRIIYDNMSPSAATQTFTLVGVKIFSGTLSAATLQDEVSVALTTPAYQRSQFERYG